MIFRDTMNERRRAQRGRSILEASPTYQALKIRALNDSIPMLEVVLTGDGS